MATPVIDPIAVIGASIVLPANINNREKFFQIVREKNQVSVDTVAARRYHASDIDESDAGHPWKLKSKYSMVFTEEEVRCAASFAPIVPCPAPPPPQTHPTTPHPTHKHTS